MFELFADRLRAVCPKGTFHGPILDETPSSHSKGV